MSDIDHEHTDEAVCPYCGHEHEGSHEFFGRNDEDTEAECGECGKEFCLSRVFSVTYTSKPKANDAPQANASTAKPKEGL